MKILAITQARYGSTRLPAKILKEVNGMTLLEIHLKRIMQAKTIDKVKIATTNEEGSVYITKVADKLGVSYYKGSLDDVLDRFYRTALPEHPDYVVRFTSDCPLVDPMLIDEVVNYAIENDYDYVNVDSSQYPDGLGTEVVKFSALERAFNEATLTSEREHVMPYIWKNGTALGGTLFRSYKYPNKFGCYNANDYRITIDEPEDFEVIKVLIEQLGIEHSWKDYIDYLVLHDELRKINSKFHYNEGYEKSIKNDSQIKKTMGKGQELYRKAKTLIPGGTMLLSKRPEMFLPENWPSYFSKAKGCEVWDLDGKHYYDMCLMGVGTNTLGYGREEVDDAVMNVISSGNMSTLNNPEEVELAERLCQLDPWAGMVRLARTGGEANAIAIRIARAASGKDKVAVCGYHGWHDWYLALNIGDSDNIKNYQLSGLEPNGVPKSLRGTTLPFFYNKFEELKDLVDKNPDLGVIKMEVSRNVEPVDNFLGKVRDLCDERGIIMIFDECTSGFRETFGGRYKKFGVNPDMAIYSKAIGNGYAISAIVGRTDIMQAAQSTFISSTFWTERIGPTAAVATLKVMEKEHSWEKITAIGLENKRRWQEIADKHGVAIKQWGIPALAGFTYESANNLAYKTYVTQEMLKKGYLVGNSMYASLAHTPEILDGYFYELDKLFAKIREFEDGRDVMKELEGPICMTGFQRLN